MSGVSVEQLLALWDDGARGLLAADPPRRRVLERIVDALVAELRRRIGAKFTAEELGELYMRGTEWCFEVARNAAPESPEAWDMPTLVGAAFSRYVRRAMDFGGGRRRVEEQ